MIRMMSPLVINATVERLARRGEESKSQKSKVSSIFAVLRLFDFQPFDFQPHGSACQFVALFLGRGMIGRLRSLGSTRKQKLKPRNTRNFTKGMGFHAVLVTPFWKRHKIPQGLLISCCLVTFMVPSSESGFKGASWFWKRKNPTGSRRVFYVFELETDPLPSFSFRVLHRLGKPVVASRGLIYRGSLIAIWLALRTPVVGA